MTGKIVVIEGADGAGGEEQSKRLLNLLKERGVPAIRHAYPDYDDPIGRIIHDFLHRKYEFSPQMLLLLYTSDFVKDLDKIKSWLEQDMIVILDRYFTSTLAYQTMQGLKREDILQMAEIFKIPKPDYIIYQVREKESLDRNESDREFIGKVLDSYDELIKKGVFGQWYVVDGEKPIEGVFSEIRKILKV
jgi:dTMP kinase